MRSSSVVAMTFATLALVPVSVGRAASATTSFTATTAPTTLVPTTPATTTPPTTPPATTLPTIVPTTVPPTTVPPTTVPPTTVPPTTTTTVPPPTMLGPPVVLPPDLPGTVKPMAQLAPAIAAPLAPINAKAPAAAIQALQQRLEDLGYWVGAIDGSYGWTTTQAVMAFQKYNGLKASGNADEITVNRMNTTEFKVMGQAYDGDLIEVDKGRQLLFVIRGGRTVWTFNTSTGSNHDYTEVNQKTNEPITGHAITPEGTFKVYRGYSDGWEKGELGELYRPRYFSGGVAVHGAPKVPNYPASHGCVRISTPAMDWMWANDIMPLKSAVWVHA